MKVYKVTNLTDRAQYDIESSLIKTVTRSVDGSAVYTFVNGQHISVNAADAMRIDAATISRPSVSPSESLAQQLIRGYSFDTLDNSYEIALTRQELATGTPRNRAEDNARRLRAAMAGKQCEPYFIVGDLSKAPNGGVFISNSPLNFIVPDQKGVPFDCAIYGMMTDAMNPPALFNIVRRHNLPEGISEEYLFSNPSKAQMFMGDMNTGANRISFADWWKNPAPERFSKSEFINLQLVGDGATPDMSRCMVVFQSEHVFPDGAADAQLTDAELDSVTTQIANEPESEYRIVPFVVDYTVASSYQNVQFPKQRGNYLLLGFASGKTAAGAQIVWSTIDFRGRSGRAWSNAPIPITAVMSVPGDVAEPSIYRLLKTPYLLRSGIPELTFTLAQRAATNANYPPNMALDAAGILYALLKKV